MRLDQAKLGVSLLSSTSSRATLFCALTLRYSAASVSSTFSRAGKISASLLAHSPLALSGKQRSIRSSMIETVTEAPGDAPSKAARVPSLAATSSVPNCRTPPFFRSEEHTSELQSLMRISYAVFCLKKKIQQQTE